MKGLELSRAYYEEYGKPMIDTQLAQYKPYLAAGLVGEGSECLGFDDELSTDHDFGWHSVCGCRRDSTRRQVPRCSWHTIACRLLTKAIRGSHLHRAEAGSEFFRWKDFIVNSPGFPMLRRTIWSGFVSRNAFWRR